MSHRIWSGALAFLAAGILAGSTLSQAETERIVEAVSEIRMEDERETEAESPMPFDFSGALGGRDEAGSGSVFVPFATDSPVLLPEIPETFSWIDRGKKPTVRSQGALGTCWAISAVSAIESELLPGTSMVFSADHMSLKNGFVISQNEGGDYSMIMSYLADWKGPVLEEEDPYGDGVSPEGLKARVHVSEMRLLKSMSTQRIKSMIYRFGPVQSSLSMDRTRTDGDVYHYYQEETSAYHDPFVEPLNHDILILGWDDSFSRDQFRIRPRQDGAWICQNTWGEEFGEKGIFYVSYEDANLFRKGGIAYTEVSSVEEFDHVYENDSLGWQARQGYGSGSAYFAGVYTAGGEETLNACGIYSTGASSSYQIYYLPVFERESDLKKVYDLVRGTLSQDGENEGENAVKALGYGYLEHPGFYTVRFDKPPSLRAGQRFALVVRIRTMSEDKPVAVEIAKDRFTESMTLEGRETYLSQTGENWERTQTRYRTNVCLKVYTRDSQGIMGTD